MYLVKLVDGRADGARRGGWNAAEGKDTVQNLAVVDLKVERQGLDVYAF